MKLIQNAPMFVVTCLVLVAAPAKHLSAETDNDLFNRFFSNILDGAPCYAHTYDDEFLGSHKAHKVRSIEIDLSKTNSDGSPNSADRFELGFAVLTRTSPEWFGQTASCKAGDAKFDCYLEGDGGLFRLTPSGADGLKLETGETGITIEGSEMLELSGKGADDRVFDLSPAKNECEAASAFFDSGNE